jgi:hypothetical protein
MPLFSVVLSSLAPLFKYSFHLCFTTSFPLSFAFYLFLFHSSSLHFTFCSCIFFFMPILLYVFIPYSLSSVSQTCIFCFTPSYILSSCRSVFLALVAFLFSPSFQQFFLHFFSPDDSLRYPNFTLHMLRCDICIRYADLLTWISKAD